MDASGTLTQAHQSQTILPAGTAATGTDAFSSDGAAITSDGAGNLSVNSVTAAQSLTTPTLYLGNVPVAPSDGQASLYFGDDGKIHALTPDGVDHVLTWS